MEKIIRHRSFVRAGAALALACGLAATSSEASTLSLQDLLNGQTVVVGHIEFGNFRNYSSVAAGGALPVDPALILVTTIADGLRLGLAFESAAFGVSPGQTKHWSFEFDGIVAGDGVQPSGDLALQLFVRVYDDYGPRKYMKLVLSDTLLNSYKLTASTEVPLTESFGLNFAKFSVEYQQQEPVPEPATLLLMGSGLVVVARGFRRRHMRPHMA